LLEFGVVTRCAVNGFGNVFEDEIEVNFILFRLAKKGKGERVSFRCENTRRRETGKLTLSPFE
jgi:hypothetical protein